MEELEEIIFETTVHSTLWQLWTLLVAPKVHCKKHDDVWGAWGSLHWPIGHENSANYYEKRLEKYERDRTNP